MKPPSDSQISASAVILHAARFLVAAWALFWIVFSLASSASQHLPILMILYYTVVPGVPFAMLAVVAWRAGTPGGMLLILVSLVMTWVYPTIIKSMPVPAVTPVLLLLALPPLLSGILLVLHRLMADPKTLKLEDPE